MKNKILAFSFILNFILFFIIFIGYNKGFFLDNNGVINNDLNISLTGSEDLPYIDESISYKISLDDFLNIRNIQDFNSFENKENSYSFLILLLKDGKSDLALTYLNYLLSYKNLGVDNESLINDIKYQFKDLKDIGFISKDNLLDIQLEDEVFLSLTSDIDKEVSENCKASNDIDECMNYYYLYRSDSINDFCYKINNTETRSYCLSYFRK